jgi:SAM-dependent methyltransferase
MIHPDKNPRYANEILAWEYDQRQPVSFPNELEWYLKYAGISGGPVLELACGSGRLLIPIARAGFTIDGVDNSEAMLDRLKGKLQSIDDISRQRIRLFCQDMTEFHTDREYSLVIIAYNSLPCLETKARILECFRNVSKNMKKDGYFLMLIRRPDLSRFIQGRIEIYDWMDKPLFNKELNLSIGSKMSSSIDYPGNRIINERTYRIIRENGTSEAITFNEYNPIIRTYEYVEMLEQSGFTVQVSDGYDEPPDGSTSKELGFVCRKK